LRKEKKRSILQVESKNCSTPAAGKPKINKEREIMSSIVITRHGAKSAKSTTLTRDPALLATLSPREQKINKNLETCHLHREKLKNWPAERLTLTAVEKARYDKLEYYTKHMTDAAKWERFFLGAREAEEFNRRPDGEREARMTLSHGMKYGYKVGCYWD
jgi:hypothetical protein